MKRRSTLSLDPSASDGTKRVPGFETAEFVSSEGTTGGPEPAATPAWSSAQPGKPRKPRAQPAAPRWGSAAVVKGLLMVVTAAVGVYLLRKRLV